jgi:putative spermidine/putrescine transport system substrate-binding protein
MIKIKKLMRSVAVAGIVVGLAIGTLPSTGAHAGEYDGVSLRIATWGGSWKQFFVEAIVPKFEALGGKIVFVTGSPQANFAKLIAARGKAPFDTMEILDAQEVDVLKSNYFQKLDLKKIPNTKYLEDYQFSDQWTATWTTQECICYNTEKFKELGIPVPTTYADLAHPALEGRVMIPDITSGGGLANFAGIVYAAGGDVLNVKPGLDLINKLKIRKFWSRGGTVVTEFQTGDIYAAVAHAGWCFRSKKAGSPIAAVHPKINDQITGVHKYGWIGIPKSTKDPKVIDAAHWFINTYLSADYQLYFARKNAVGPVNKVAILNMAKEPAITEFLQTDPAKLNKYLRIDYKKVNIVDWMDQWNRMITE